MKKKIEMLINSDFEDIAPTTLTQLIRGRIFIYVDFLLGTNNYTDEQVDAINDFLYCILRMIVAW